MGNPITFTLTEEVHLSIDELRENDDFQEAIKGELEDAFSDFAFAFKENGDMVIVLSETELIRENVLTFTVERIAENVKGMDDIEEAKTFCRRLLELLD